MPCISAYAYFIMAHGVVCSIISLINLVFRYIVQVYCVDMVHPADFAMCVHTCKVFLHVPYQEFGTLLLVHTVICTWC